MSLLDDILLFPAPLAPLSPLAAQYQTSFSLGGKENSRPLQIGGQWVVGQTTPIQTAGRWPDLCARISERGLLLDCHVAALEELPVASIPRRLFRQPVGTSIMLDDLQSADVVEITCQAPGSNIWGWPPEVDSNERMSEWVNSVRHLVGKNTPFGLGVVAGVDDKSIQALSNWPIDFITLYSDGAIELLVDSVSNLRTQLKKLNQQLPIIVRTAVKRVDHLIKIISLGASAVTIDGYLADVWKQPATSSKGGFLGTQLPTTGATKIKCPVREHLDTLQAKLLEALQTTRSRSPSELTASLRALTPTAARLARIPMTGD